MRVVSRHVPHPAHEAPVLVQTFHAYMFFDTYRDTVQWSDGFPVRGQVRVEFCGASQGPLGEELGDAVSLRWLALPLTK